MNQPLPRPRVVRPRRTAVTQPDFSAFQDTPTAEAAQRAAIEQARLNAGVEASSPPPIQLDIGRMPHITLPRPAQPQVPFGGQPFVQLPAEVIGNQRTPENLARQASYVRPVGEASTEDLRGMGVSDVELVQLGRMQGPIDATADELRAQGYGEQYVASHASDIRTPAQVRTAEGEIRRLSALTPALPELPVAHQRPAPIVRRGAMDVPAMPSSAPSLDEGYAVRDGALIPRARPVQVPEGYAVTSDGRMLPRAEPVPMSFMPTEQGGAGYDAGSSQYAPGITAGSPQFEHDIEVGAPQFEHTITAGSPQFEHDIAAGPVQMETTGTVEMGAPQNIRSLAPRVGVPRRRAAPYVAGLPNAPGGTSEMPSALQQPTAWPARQAPPRRTPLDTQHDTLDLNQRFAMSRAEDAQDAGQRLADIEIARQRRMNENQMDRERAEGLARAAVQRAADRAASIRIDPSRAMQGASGIANVIAVVLGGIGSGITGGPNQPLAMVQQNIERDLAAQRTDLDTARNAVADQQSILGNIRQEFQTREAADNAFREFALRQAAAEVEIQAGRANYAEARDRGANLHEQLNNEADALRQRNINDEATRLLAFDRSRAETGYFDARARATLATAGSTEAENARRARMALMRRPAPGSVEAWDRMTPAQQAQALENHQSILLTGIDAVTASRMSGVPIAAGERAPVTNGARAPSGDAANPANAPWEQADSVERGRRLTMRQQLMATGASGPEASRLTNSPEGRMELPGELAARVNVADTHLRELEDVVARGGDIPGFGIFDGRLPDFTTPEGARLRRRADTLADAHQRMMSGAGGAVQEVQFYRDLLMGDGTEEGLRIGLETMRSEMNAILGNTAGGTSNAADQDALAAQLGVAPRTGPSPAPAPAAPVARPRIAVPRIVAPQGGGMGNFE